MKLKTIEHWLTLADPEFLSVLRRTPEPLLFRILQEDIDGRLMKRLKSALPPAVFESLQKRAFAARLAKTHKKAA